MKTVNLTTEDAAQVKAILMTHAEMQDRRTLDGETVLGRLRVEQPEELEMIDELITMGEELVEDTENLKRIAHLF